jgi:secondary thiamine-phosphate synthase enzyme
MYRHTTTLQTTGRGWIELDALLHTTLQAAQIDAGLCNVFLHHTSASLVFSENADPTVRADLERFFARLAPDGDRLFDHTQEGPDDMPAHVRTVLTQNSVTLPVSGGRAALGTWQGLYLWEHRTAPHRRRLTITVW